MEWSCEVQSNFAALRIFTPLVETNENDASDEPPHILFHSAPFLNELPSSQSSNFLPKCLKWWKIPSKLDQTVCLRTAPKGTLLLTGGYFSLHVRNILSLRPRKEANSSSAAGIPALSEAIATAGTLDDTLLSVLEGLVKMRRLDSSLRIPGFFRSGRGDGACPGLLNPRPGGFRGALPDLRTSKEETLGAC